MRMCDRGNGANRGPLVYWTVGRSVENVNGRSSGAVSVRRVWCGYTNMVAAVYETNLDDMVKETELLGVDDGMDQAERGFEYPSGMCVHGRWMGDTGEDTYSSKRCVFLRAGWAVDRPIKDGERANVVCGGGIGWIIGGKSSRGAKMVSVSG